MTDADPTTDPDADPTTDPDAREGEVTLADRVRSHVRENKTGMVHDLVFAVAWVALVSVLFDLVFTSAPQWAFYMFMLAGIPAYFGFFISLEIARENRG